MTWQRCQQDTQHPFKALLYDTDLINFTPYHYTYWTQICASQDASPVSFYAELTQIIVLLVRFANEERKKGLMPLMCSNRSRDWLTASKRCYHGSQPRCSTAAKRRQNWSSYQIVIKQDISRLASHCTLLYNWLRVRRRGWVMSRDLFGCVRGSSLLKSLKIWNWIR